MPVTKRMSKRRIAKRNRVKVFCQYVNYNHVIPTRYVLPSESFDCKNWVTEQQLSSVDERKTVVRSLKNLFKDKFAHVPKDKSGKPLKDVSFLKSKLRF